MKPWVVILLVLIGLAAFYLLGWLVAILALVGLFFNIGHLRDRVTSSATFFTWGQARRGWFSIAAFAAILVLWGGLTGPGRLPTSAPRTAAPTTSADIIAVANSSIPATQSPPVLAAASVTAVPPVVPSSASLGAGPTETSAIVLPTPTTIPPTAEPPAEPSSTSVATTAPASPTSAASSTVLAAVPTSPPSVALVAVTSTPTSVAAVAGQSLAFTSLTSVRLGQMATAAIQTAPGASCSIVYVTPHGTDSVAAGLVPKTADGNGLVSWTWLIGARTIRGTGAITVTCNGVSLSSPIQIG